MVREDSTNKAGDPLNSVGCDAPILILVLGVHRSGTSVLTQGLRRLGAHAGIFQDTHDDDNPEGYAEHPEVRAFNDRLLNFLGASWDNWGFQASLVDWSAPLLIPWWDEAVALLRAAFVGTGPFLLKDPRCVMLAPFWERVVPMAGFTLRRVLILRDPAEVAESQRQRAMRRPNEFHVIAAAEPMAALWTVMMMECLTAVHDSDTLLIGHAELLKDPALILAEAAAFAGLAPDDEVSERAAMEVNPALYRAHTRANVESDGPWMQAARALFIDLTRPDISSRLSAAQAHAIASSQKALAALVPGLPAVRASIAQMNISQELWQMKLAELSRVIWAIAPMIGNGPQESLETAIASLTDLADGSDLPDKNLAFSHSYCRLLLHAGRQIDALAWLDRIRPQFGHMDVFVQLEQSVQARG